MEGLHALLQRGNGLALDNWRVSDLMQSKSKRLAAAYAHGWKPPGSVPGIPQPKLFNSGDVPKIQVPGGAVSRGGYQRKLKGL